MDILKDNIPVTMIRNNVDGFPYHALPDGYRIRPFEPGDERTWYAIERAAEFIGDIKDGLFEQEFGVASDELPRRMLFLTAPDGDPVGTATAWFDPDYRGRNYGRLHWVAVRPDHQGRGLAKPLVSHVCGQLKKLGHERTYLLTSSPRLAAIRTYLHFGFEPAIRNDDDRAVWDELMKHIP